ncbi:ABC transporter permease [Paramicrobacterium agarici]|uniref:Nucleoside ABC transporter membrane protein n=1 Tax=Paramicrobacterium agarici TaxID=630514 RepID=A0A2A9DZB7_9MICO|nr:ABC transporter permease [Microbacterium agarici]PFG31944.1 nucleoside ABC transporter membrane protein [Microbacterium agarici]
MSTVSHSAETSVSESLEVAKVRSWKAPIAFAVVTIAALILFVLLAREGDTTFKLSNDSDAIVLPPLVMNAAVTGVVVTILLALITAVSVWRTINYQTTWLWLISLFAALFLIGFFAWAAAGGTVPLPGFLLGTVALSAPLIFGALGGVISERSGVVNIAIEGQLLAGAFSSAVVASVTQNPYLGLIAAMIAGMLVSFILAAFSIKYFVDQIIVGVVVNVLVLGLTSFLYSQVLTENTPLLNSPPRFERISIPFLSEIPLIGPVFFRQTIIIYVMYIAIALVYWGMFHTKWGLRVRAVGEHPQAADTVGIRVNTTRFWNVSLAGAIAGFGGAYFTLGSVGGFTKDMTAGMGFIALAAVIFGQWNPIKATLAALLFGFATNLQNLLGALGSPVESEFLLMLPYIVTILAVAGFVGQSRPPAASGSPYIKS